jgi:GT2 family glycosyltransferase
MKVLVLVVVYNSKVECAKTFKSLLRCYISNPGDFENLKLIIYDNGLINQQDDITVPFNYMYINNPRNDGLAIAYNYALDYGISEDFNWILLLDQDSCLPDDFISNLNRTIEQVESNEMIKAIVPKMVYKGTFFSPSKVLFGGIHRPIDMNIYGICPFEVFSIGSGCLVRSSFFQKIGGFNNFFWLDCLDRWIFYEINKANGKVFITSSIIEHELSVMDYSKFVNEKRYLNIMKYETYFMKFYKSKTENIVYYLRLLKRAISFQFSKKTRKFASMTFKHLSGLIFSNIKLEENIPNKQIKL